MNYTDYFLLAFCSSIVAVFRLCCTFIFNFQVFMDGHRVSTIIVDSNEDSVLVHVDDQGFHPKEISIPKVLC